MKIISFDKIIFIYVFEIFEQNFVSINMTSKICSVLPFPSSFSFGLGIKTKEQLIGKFLFKNLPKLQFFLLFLDFQPSSSFTVECTEPNKGKVSSLIETAIQAGNISKFSPSQTKKSKNRISVSKTKKDLSVCVHFMSQENEKLRRVKTKLTRSVDDKRREIAYLRSLLANSSSIVKILNNAGVKNFHSTDGEDAFVDEIHSSEMNFSRCEIESDRNGKNSKDLSGICVHMKGNSVTLLPPCRECVCDDRRNGSEDDSDEIPTPVDNL